jgi:hypothetical protein
MSEVTHTAARSLSEAASDAARMIEHCVDAAVSELQAIESHASGEPRRLATDAWRALVARRKPWSERFPRLLRASFDTELRAGEQPGAAAPFEPTSGWMALTLVDDAEIARKIEASRLAQELAATLERPLAELDGLMSSALGLPGVQPERNPLRPAVYARALRKLMDGDDVDPTWPAQWMRHMVATLATELGQLYRAQCERLTQASVHAADYRLLTSPSKGAAATGGAYAAGAGANLSDASAPSASQPLAPAAEPQPFLAPAGQRAAAAVRSSGFMDLPPQAVDGLRLRLFLARDDAQAREPVAASFRAQAEAELRELEERTDARKYDPAAAREQMHVPVVERAQRTVDTDTPLSESVWGAYGTPRQRSLVRGRLKTEAREIGQVFGLEVVRRLINKVAEDARLLTPVREAIVALEPSLSRLAMVAPRFFSDEAHPGRLLVERVAERSFKYNDEFSVEFQGFLGPVAQTFTRLNELERFDSAIPFQAALATLQAGWHAQDELDEAAQRKVLEAVQFAERRQHEAGQITADLRERADLSNAPEEVQDFVLGTWSMVIAQARLTQTDAGLDPGGHLAILGDLLWSVNLDAALHDPARAFVVIPRVLLKLRAGLAALGQSPQESEAFFHALERLHRPVMKLRAKQRHRELAPAEREIVEASPSPRRPDQPWMPPEELRAAGFEETLPSDFAALSGGERTLQQEPQALDELEVENALASLAPGCWVDLYSRQQWRRARLIWAAERGTLFMFVSHGGQPHCMSRRSIQRLARERLLRVLAGDGVVPRALERMAQPSAPMPLAA